MSKMKICYVITERNGKKYFNRIGVAFVNRDETISVKLDALPVSGQIYIREDLPKKEGAAGARQSQSAPETDDNGSDDGFGF